MSYKKTVLGPAPVSEDAVSQLVMLFPALGRAEARGALSAHGSLAAAASALVDADADAANEAAAAAAEEERAGPGGGGCGGEEDELPSYIRCPKCYSPDVVQECESSESLIVCLKCQHHFTRARAKKGRSHGVNGGCGGGAREKGAPRGGRRREDKPRRTRSPRHPQTVREVPLSKEDLAPPPRSPVEEVGPVEKKLMENRAAAAERQMLRLVVSHAASPKEKRVLTVPRSDAYATLMKQARAKYRLRKPLKGVRLLPDSVGIPPEDVQNLQDGTEVLVTLTSDFETPHHKKKHHHGHHRHHDATAGADDTAGAAGSLLTSPALSATSTSPSSQSTGSTLSSADPAPTFEACLASADAATPSSTADDPAAPVSPKPLPSTHPAPAAPADADATAAPAPAGGEAAAVAGGAGASDVVASALAAPQSQETSVGA